MSKKLTPCPHCKLHLGHYEWCQDKVETAVKPRNEKGWIVLVDWGSSYPSWPTAFGPYTVSEAQERAAWVKDQGFDADWRYTISADNLEMWVNQEMALAIAGLSPDEAISVVVKEDGDEADEWDDKDEEVSEATACAIIEDAEVVGEMCATVVDDTIPVAQAEPLRKADAR